MMDCNKTAQLFSEYYEKTASDSMITKVEEHLATCADCRRDYARFSHAMKLLSEPVELLDAPSSLRASVMARVSQLPPQKRAGVFESIQMALIGKHAYPIRIGLAAALSATVVVAAIFSKPTTTRPAVAGNAGSGFSAPIAREENSSILFLPTLITNAADKVVYTFSIHAPGGETTGALKAYVVQKDNALTADSAAIDPASAQSVWKNNEPISTGSVVLTLPVTLPAPTTKSAGALMLMLLDASMNSSATTRNLAIVPYGALPLGATLSQGASPLDALRFIASTKNEQIYLDSGAIEVLSKAKLSTKVETSSISIDDVLSGNDDLVILRRTDHAVFIGRM